MIRVIRRWAHHPTTNVVVGVVMVLSAMGEMLGELLSEPLGFEVNAAHGLFVAGVVHTVKALPELADGITRFDGKQSE